jgi:peptide/nickel transport system ATP-binding protein
MTGFSILGLVDPPGRIVGGRILFHGNDLTKLSEDKKQEIRGAKIAMIFQDPLMTLNPVLKIDIQMMEAIFAHEKVSKTDAWTRARDALVQVGIASPEHRLKAFPHQLSGGMRQRVAIAVAMLNSPEIIIADEPTTALDVTIQAQILYEVKKLCQETGTALIWITHDLAVVAGLVDKISVMYAGHIVEQGSVDEVIDRPLHPYTRGLIGCVPSQSRRGSKLFQIPGMAPSLIGMPRSCAFRDRCPKADHKCLEVPELIELAPGRFVSCFNPYVGSLS